MTFLHYSKYEDRYNFLLDGWLVDHVKLFMSAIEGLDPVIEINRVNYDDVKWSKGHRDSILDLLNVLAFGAYEDSDFNNYEEIKKSVIVLCKYYNVSYFQWNWVNLIGR